MRWPAPLQRDSPRPLEGLTMADLERAARLILLVLLIVLACFAIRWFA